MKSGQLLFDTDYYSHYSTEYRDLYELGIAVPSSEDGGDPNDPWGKSLDEGGLEFPTVDTSDFDA